MRTGLLENENRDVSTPFFEVTGLTKYFGGLAAVNNVSFQIAEDEIVGLIGPNGSGKTTLLRLIAGILHPSNGEVFFKGEVINGQRLWEITNKGIATTFQTVKPLRNLPVIANVVLSCLSAGSAVDLSTADTAESRAESALELLGIKHLASERAATLSHGDLKRLEVARAIGTEPELLLLDEPFGGLTPLEIGQMITSLKQIHLDDGGRTSGRGTAMLIVEHRLAHLLDIANRIIVLNFGEIIADGSPQEIKHNKDVIKAYTGREDIDVTA